MEKEMVINNKKQITSFRGDHFFLSNFYPCKIVYRGREYKTAEHAFQAQKCVTKDDIIEIQEANNPQMAKRIGKKVKLREDWEDVKVSIMTEVVSQKFLQHPHLIEMLLQTGDEELIEGNTWRDYFWGVCKGKGKNNLGKILMKVREAYKSIR